jgi:hypothetical protein
MQKIIAVKKFIAENTTKQFLIFNKKSAFFIDAISIEQAKEKALKMCDYSDEVIIREVEQVKFFLNNLKIDL